MKRTYKIFIEAIAALFASVVIVFLLALWIVTAKPFASADFSDLISSTVETLVPGTKAYVPESMLAWDNEARAIVVTGQNVALTTTSDAPIAKAGKINLKLSVLNLLRGRFIPTEIRVSEVNLFLRRDNAGHILFSGEQAPSEAAPTKNSDDVFESVRSFLKEITHKNLNHAVVLRDIHIVLHDDVSGHDQNITIPSVRVDHRGYNVNAQAKIDVGDGAKAAHLDATYLYDPNQKTHALGLHFDKLVPSVLTQGFMDSPIVNGVAVPLSGQISFVVSQVFDLVSLTAQLHGDAGVLTLPDLWDEARTVKSFDLDALYDRAAQKIALRNIMIDFYGPRLAVQGTADALPPSSDTPHVDMGFTVGVKLSNLPMDSFATVWPKVIIPNARIWIADHMHKGSFTQGLVTVKGRFAWNDLSNPFLDSATGQVTARDGTVTFLDGMPPVIGTNADATLDLDHMDVRLSGGGISAVRIQPFTIRLFDFQKDVQQIEIPAKLTGPIPDVLRLLDAPPLGYAKAIGLNAADVQGDMDGQLTLRFPLLASLALKDVGVSASATLKGFGASKLIPGVPLSNGDMTLDVGKDGYGIKGPLSLSGVPLQVVWQGRFGPETPAKPRNQATLSGTLSDAQIKALGLDPAAYMKGSVGLALRFSSNDKKQTQLAGDIDLKPAALSMDVLNWKKPVGEPGMAHFSVALEKGKPAYIKLLDLQGPQLKAKGTATLDADSLQLLSLDLQPLIVGRTNANLHITPSLAPKGPLRVALEGASLDISGEDTSKKPAEATPEKPAPRDYTLKLDKVYTSPTGFLTALRGEAVRDELGWVSMDIHTLAQGTHPVEMILADREGRRHLSLTADDFGIMLKGFGLTDTIAGGQVKITGESTPENPRAIKGQIKIGSFEVSGLPILVRLVSAASPFGFADLITGHTSFKSMLGGFEWNGGDLELQQIRMIGSAYGLNIGGRLDLDKNVANLNGTLVPFSFINSILNAIPMLGNVITGGEGQGVLAVSYSVSGPLSDPSISVNPISLLTPGFIRNLFFADEDTPTAPFEKNEGAVQEKKKLEKEGGGK